ncbi:MAG: RNA polymerase sigma factor [Armatimonas sp.]
MQNALPFLDQLEECCRTDVFRYALRRVGQRADAEDIVQETLCAAIEQQKRYSGQVPLRFWLYGIARRKVANCLRRRSRRQDPLPGSPTPADARLLRDEASAELRRLIMALPELQREALLLQCSDGLSQAEIAQALGKSVGAVNSLLARARENIRQHGAAYFNRRTPMSDDSIRDAFALEDNAETASLLSLNTAQARVRQNYQQRQVGLVSSIGTVIGIVSMTWLAYSISRASQNRSADPASTLLPSGVQPPAQLLSGLR